MYFELFLKFLYCFICIICFSVTFQVEKRDLVFCGINGATGWIIYKILLVNGYPEFISNFYGAVLVTFLSRCLASLRKEPITIFLTTGILPLVPGSWLYNTMLNIVYHNDSKAIYFGSEALKIAGAIALGIAIVFSLPNKLFNLLSFKD